jgi:hypothetical protein
MAGSSSPRADDNDCLRLPAASPPRTRGAEKKESTDLRLNQPCPPFVTPSSISYFGRPLSGVRTAENKSLKNTGVNGFCQSSAKPAFLAGLKLKRLLFARGYGYIRNFGGDRCGGKHLSFCGGCFMGSKLSRSPNSKA